MCAAGQAMECPEAPDDSSAEAETPGKQTYTTVGSSVDSDSHQIKKPLSTHSQDPVTDGTLTDTDTGADSGEESFYEESRDLPQASDSEAETVKQGWGYCCLEEISIKTITADAVSTDATDVVAMVNEEIPGEEKDHGCSSYDCVEHAESSTSRRTEKATLTGAVPEFQRRRFSPLKRDLCGLEPDLETTDDGSKQSDTGVETPASKKSTANGSSGISGKDIRQIYPLPLFHRSRCTSMFDGASRLHKTDLHPTDLHSTYLHATDLHPTDLDGATECTDVPNEDTYFTASPSKATTPTATPWEARKPPFAPGKDTNDIHPLAGPNRHTDALSKDNDVTDTPREANRIGIPTELTECAKSASLIASIREHMLEDPDEQSRENAESGIKRKSEKEARAVSDFIAGMVFQQALSTAGVTLGSVLNGGNRAGKEADRLPQHQPAADKLQKVSKTQDSKRSKDFAETQQHKEISTFQNLSGGCCHVDNTPVVRRDVALGGHGSPQRSVIRNGSEPSKVTTEANVVPHHCTVPETVQEATTARHHPDVNEHKDLDVLTIQRGTAGEKGKPQPVTLPSNPEGEQGRRGGCQHQSLISMRQYMTFFPNADLDLLQHRPWWQRLIRRYLHDKGEDRDDFLLSTHRMVCRDCHFVQRGLSWSLWLEGWKRVVALLLYSLLVDTVRLGCKAVLLVCCWVSVAVMYPLPSLGKWCCNVFWFVMGSVYASVGLVCCIDLVGLLPKSYSIFRLLVVWPLLCWCRFLVSPVHFAEEAVDSLGQTLYGIIKVARGVHNKCVKVVQFLERFPVFGVFFQLCLLPCRSCCLWARCWFAVFEASVLSAVAVIFAFFRFLNLVLFTFHAEIERLARL